MTEAVSVALRRNYIVYESLRLRIANYHRIAERIAPRVAELTGKKPRVETLVVAIKRFSDAMADERASMLESILEDAQVTLVSGVIELSLRARDVPTTRILDDVMKVAAGLSMVPEIVQLTGVVNVVASTEDGRLIERELRGRYQTQLLDGMAKIEVRISRQAEKAIGLATYIAELLYMNGVVVHSAYVGRPDILLVIEDRFGPMAYEVLRTRSRVSLSSGG
jgi:hypothetical protein